MSTLHIYTFYVSGTHCSACKHLIEQTLTEESDIERAVVSLSDETLAVHMQSDTDAEALSMRLTKLLSAHGYGVHTEKPQPKLHTNDWLYGGIFAVLAVLGFLALERAGVTSLVGASEATLPTAFLVGLVASVSTCLAVVGGLVLSVSATYAHEGRGWRPQAFFHAGRLVGFFILGGLLGLLGEALQIGFYGSAVLGVVAAIVMLVLGIHLLEITKKVRAFTLPRGIADTFTTVVHKAGPATPLLLGAVTFFLPCGFTQSMQILSLSSGSVVTGALTMFVFALGTLPVLALLSYGSLDLAKSKYKGVFFKAAGMLVILFALFNIYNALVVFGVLSPLFSF